MKSDRCFYSYFNMTDSRFSIDEDFIRKGLSRNEDDYFAVTGKELSLFWHAPYYFVNSSILTAAQRLSYSYIGRDVDTLDWVSNSRSGNAGDLYRSAADLVEYIMEQKKPGSILPFRVGRTEEGRDDYLFQKLDLLLNDLIVAGYGIVPVSTLMEHGR